ncbi:hypothetical protein H9Y05_03125 [Crocinitomicaceae bacterium CZZ-1]|uniref:Uncharacterized protein n=1 Tax=Taishania pollutisoli TaxID=2766479 RepID=A0A8J6PHC1_9FLAO|nr:hypothetical protein [Taishania pollutisoli]MBC9811459.1 hypothetical protein [Taishania pollutisoli]NGF77151.1 hypothetical protein [Fluviicola sp. SGL-29]
MERYWNYLFYLQHKLLNVIGVKYFQRPLSYIIFFIFPKLKKKKKEILNAAASSIDHKEMGFNLGFAFSHMFLTTVVIFSIICLYVTVLINYKIKEDIKYFITGVLLLSYLLNYWLLWKKDIYLTYFKKFEKQPFSQWHYLYIIFFHLGVWGFGILSIHWTIGFNL